jgi:hypothetical protein
MLSVRGFRWTVIAMVAVIAFVAVGLWWRSRIADTRLGPAVARTYAASIKVSGFTRHVQYRLATGSAVVFLGPGAMMVQPGLITGPELRLGSSRGQPATEFEDSIADGIGKAPNGTECDVALNRYRPGTALSDNYSLSVSQAERAQRGDLQVLVLEVHCGGK